MGNLAAPIVRSAVAIRIDAIELAGHPRVNALDVVQQALGVAAQDVARLPEVRDQLHPLGADSFGGSAGVDDESTRVLLGLGADLPGLRLGLCAKPVNLFTSGLHELCGLAFSGPDLLLGAGRGAV